MTIGYIILLLFIFITYTLMCIAFAKYAGRKDTLSYFGTLTKEKYALLREKKHWLLMPR